MWSPAQTVLHRRSQPKPRNHHSPEKKKKKRKMKLLLSFLRKAWRCGSFRSDPVRDQEGFSGLRCIERETGKAFAICHESTKPEADI